MKKKATIGDRIASLRKSKSLSLRRLAELAGCSHPHLSEIEQDKKNLSRPLLESIARALSVSTSYLLHGEHSRRPSVAKLIHLVEQQGDIDDLQTLRDLLSRLAFALTWEQTDRLRAKESVLKTYERYAKKGDVPESTKAALQAIQKEIDDCYEYMRALG